MESFYWKLKMMFDLVTVGHFTIDHIYSPMITRAKQTLGGPPTYVSIAAAKLNAQVSVISKVGEDFLKEYVEWLQSNNIDLSGLKQVKNSLTTRFILKYNRGWKRKLWAKSIAPPILISDLPNSIQSKAIHVAPIANELSAEVVKKLQKSTRTLSLDPQGFVRSFNEQGKVYLKNLTETSVLNHVDIFKSSQEEVKMVAKTTNIKHAMETIHHRGVKIVIVTRGAKGALLFFNNTFYDIPSCKPQVVLDPTGAGDIFIGAFLAEYVTQGRDPLWCGCVGAASASFIVEGLGPQLFGEREETYARAREIYTKII
jgi:sugar/nucleoside kinase (ribokinase family)